MADKITGNRIDMQEVVAKLLKNSLTSDQVQQIVDYKISSSFGEYARTYNHQLTLDDFYEDDPSEPEVLTCNLPLTNNKNEAFRIGSELHSALSTQYPNALYINFKLPEGREYISIKHGLILELYASDATDGIGAYILGASNKLYDSFVQIYLSQSDNIVVYWNPLSVSITVDLLSEY